MESKITKFITDLETFDTNKSVMVKELVTLFTRNKDIEQKFIYGGIGMYLDGILVGGIYVSKYQVSLVFSRGNELKDKYGVLEGVGKCRRHIKLILEDEVKSKNCDFYIKNAIELY